MGWLVGLVVLFLLALFGLFVFFVILGGCRVYCFGCSVCWLLGLCWC